jgi:hypothetical protein
MGRAPATKAGQRTGWKYVGFASAWVNPTGVTSSKIGLAVTPRTVVSTEGSRVWGLAEKV